MGPDVNAVDEFMRLLEHPLKAEVQAVRTIVLGSNLRITEAIKWNAPSFACGAHFATFNLRPRDAVHLILHFGAKRNEISTDGVRIDDPTKLLRWRAKDRAIVEFRDMAAVEAGRAALEAIVLRWITHVR
jgi:Domain of unknown function (DU1801)